MPSTAPSSQVKLGADGSKNTSRSSRLLSLLLALVLLVNICLALVFSVTNPIFEAPDETFHIGFIKWLNDGKGLPVQPPPPLAAWQQEGSQPPLYYVLGSVLTRWVDSSDFAQVLRYNLLSNRGAPGTTSGLNIILHDPARERFPYHGTVLLIHLVRLLSICCGVVTVVFTFKVAQELARAGRAGEKWRDAFMLCATVFTAFNPMFIFMQASANNDNLITCLASVALWLLLTILRGETGLGRFIALGFVLGAALLAKLTGVPLLMFTSATLLLLTLSRRDWRGLGAGLVVSIGLALALAGWWYIRNWRLYGDPSGLVAFLAIVGRRSQPFNSLAQAVSEYQGLYWSFWALFGWFNVFHAFSWVYPAVTWLGRLVCIGLLCVVLRWRSLRADFVFSALLLAGAWVIVEVMSLVRWTLLTPASQGRLLFPAIAALSSIFALALLALFPRQFSMAVTVVCSCLLLVISASVPQSTLLPTYALPRQWTAEASNRASTPQNPVHLTFTVPQDGDGPARILLLGYDIETPRVSPGQVAAITLYWQTPQPLRHDYPLFIFLQGPGSSGGALITYHGRGNYPTSLWPAGEIIQDRELIRVTGMPSDGPGLLKADMGLLLTPDYSLTWRDDDRAQVTDAAGRLLGSSTILFSIKLEGVKGRIFPGAHPLALNWNNEIELTGYNAPVRARSGTVLPVTLYWRSQRQTTRDYTIFVHLINEQGQLVEQHDARPAQDSYPTPYWEPGETIADRHELYIPPTASGGHYRLEVGIYQVSTLTRAPLLDAAGHVTADHVIVAAVEIEK